MRFACRVSSTKEIDVSTDALTAAESDDLKLFDEIDQLMLRLHVERDARKHLLEKLAKQDAVISRMCEELSTKTHRFQTFCATVTSEGEVMRGEPS
jgi:hypothetical protein